MEASPTSEGSQGLFVVAQGLSHATETQSSTTVVCWHAPVQTLNLSVRKGCVSSRGKGGNCVFAVLIETSVANPWRSAGRQNVAQC